MIRFRQSFRFRIIALTLLVAGTVLLAFGFASRFALYRIKISTVDQSLRTQPVPGFPDPRHTRSWERLFQAMDNVSSRLFKGDIYLMVYGGDSEVFYRSEFWPEGLSADRFPVVEGELREISAPDPEFDPARWFENRRRRGAGVFGGPGDGSRGDPGPNDIRRRGPERVFRPIGEPLAFTRPSREGHLRFGVYRFSGYNVAMGVELSGVATEMTQLRNSFLTSLPFAIGVLAFGAWLIASRAIKPIEKLTATARGMSVKTLGERIERGDEDREFSELIEVFNGMLERLERSFHQATRFSADAAHELKTPLTILQGHLESALQEAPDDSDQQRKLALLLEETQRLRGITRRLLLLAQADGGQLKVSGEDMRLAPIVEESIEDFEMQAEGVKFEVEVQGDPVAKIDRSLFAQIIQNLLSNATKYNDAESPWVRVKAGVDDSFAWMEVSNGGEGIPESAQNRLFGRFMRVDSARNRGVDGFGLGLNLSREFARAMQGELELMHSNASETVFRLTFPKSS